MHFEIFFSDDNAKRVDISVLPGVACRHKTSTRATKSVLESSNWFENVRTSQV